MPADEALDEPPDEPPDAPPDEADGLRSVTSHISALIGACAPLGADATASRLLWRELERTALGGRHLRARLVLGSHAAFGAPRPAAVVGLAAGFELLHAGFLVHDDLLDGDRVRRGRPNLLAEAERDALARGCRPAAARRWASASAVLAGDVAIALAQRAVSTVEAPAATRDALVGLFTDALVSTVVGEAGDVALQLGTCDADVETALAVARAKTAAYTVGAPLAAGAVLAEAPRAAVGALSRAGALLGEAYQMLDDLDGVFGDERSTGKSVVSDLRAGKVTVLVLHARSSARWRAVEEWFGRDDLDRDQARVLRRELARTVAPRRVAEHVDRLLDEAGAVARDELPGSARGLVTAVVDDLRRRLAGAARAAESAAG
ncbi:polyprenyl synthetase family protein [Cellulomonas carbonis]|uniref:Geranylgeranyl pyrophosphate synthase n=1 Tax=Cellulomonas carbonis T26 TaxID=947969 RepID=A0A0A0BPG6_9CELL|nr:polyprenyl synthetase family protein [Cellulomonas carbonis]KGM09845.1 geranylgeranyl pyrophosphate synthase [Cellulomonas carbonis T26]GGC13451.1 geranylgeranyl pyrophosphate synthase [Cellulomonas carbonis]